ncbi:unnamed protein product [Amoebophrya sp. A120]|nr:unnamed protein product [Amoebophrya sp. A120]|eukprot:GSA120T00006104001.1
MCDRSTGSSDTAERQVVPASPEFVLTTSTEQKCGVTPVKCSKTSKDKERHARTPLTTTPCTTASLALEITDDDGAQHLLGVLDDDKHNDHDNENDARSNLTGSDLSDFASDDEDFQLPLKDSFSLFTRIQAGAFDSKNFEEYQMVRICKFSTVERFQAIFQNVEKPSKIVQSVFAKLEDEHLSAVVSTSDKYVDAIAYFKDGYFPSAASSDSRARWDCRLRAKETLPVEVDEMWVDVVTNLVAGQFSDDVIGVLLCPRERNVVKIELWLNTFADERQCRKTGQKFARILKAASQKAIAKHGGGGEDASNYYYAAPGHGQETTHSQQATAGTLKSTPIQLEAWNGVLKCLSLEEERKAVLYRLPQKKG